MKLIYNGSRVTKFKASLFLDNNAQLLVYQWFKNVCFPDKDGSNISRLMNLKDDILYGMISHECHVFMQRLILPVYQDQSLFRDICFNKLYTQHMEKLEMNIIQTICKLEMIFSLSFFHLMEHLPIHLSFEENVGGPSSIDECIHSRG
jgi:hypothetical protein